MQTLIKQRSIYIGTILFALFIPMLIANIMEQTQTPSLRYYTSLCASNDTECHYNELNFIELNGRTPATDSELMSVYSINDKDDLFKIEPPSSTQLLPMHIEECIDCYTYKP